MKNLLVYLHGFGFDNFENAEFQFKLAETLNAELLSINAPLPSGRDRGGYAWFNIIRDTPTSPMKSVFDEKIVESKDYILKIVKEKMNERNIKWENVTFCGRSQGALMSLIIGLTSEKKCKAIIPLAGFVSLKVLNESNIVSNPPVLWIECEKDEVLDKGSQKSYRKLENIGVKIKHFIDKNSDHEIMNNSIIDIIKENI